MSRASADTQEVAGDAALSGAFAYDALQYRVVFGSGTLARLGDEADRLGIRHALILTTRHQRSEGERIGGQLGSRFAAAFADAEMHTPVEVTEAAVQVVDTNDIDGLIAIGGGSTVGLGKALSARTGLPQIAVPTTYAGSEMTPILGETRGGIKTTRRSQRSGSGYRDLRCRSDPGAAAGSLGIERHERDRACGRSALCSRCQSADLADGRRRHRGARRARCREFLTRRPTGAGRRDALYGAWLCGTCLGAVGMSLHHKLCHVLGGSFDLPHALTHAIVLPHVAAYNAAAAPEAMHRIARALGQPDAALGLYDLARRLNIPKRLADIGMPHAGIAEAADLAVRNPYANPRPVDRAALHGLIGRGVGWRPAVAALKPRHLRHPEGRHHMAQFDDQELTAEVHPQFRGDPEPAAEVHSDRACKIPARICPQHRSHLRGMESRHRFPDPHRPDLHARLRQEFILLSDVLGVSMLVDAVNHREREGATQTTVLGPFYVGEHKPMPHGADISAGIGGEPMFVPQPCHRSRRQTARERRSRCLARRR